MPFKISEDIVDSLLHKLGSDDAFRTQFQANPRQALASLGFAPAEDNSNQQGIWMCLTVTELASKEAIRASHGALRKQLLTSQASYKPVSLEVAKPIQVKRAA